MLAAGLHPGPTGAEQYPGVANGNVPPAPERPAPDAPGAGEADVAGLLPPRVLPGPSGIPPVRQPAQRTFSETSTVLGETPRRAPLTSTRPPVTRQDDRRRRARGAPEPSQWPNLTSGSAQAPDGASVAVEGSADRTDRVHAWRHSIGGPSLARHERPERITAQPRPPRHRAQNEGPPPFAENMGFVTMARPQGYDVEQAQPPLHHGTTAHYVQPPAGLMVGNLTWDDLTWSQKSQILRLPWSSKGALKNHFVCGLGELVGTTLFLFFAFAGTEVANIQAANSGTDTTTGNNNGFNISVLFYISVAFGFSLIVNVWIFFRISGGLFNPAITFGSVTLF